MGHATGEREVPPPVRLSVGGGRLGEPNPSYVPNPFFERSGVRFSVDSMMAPSPRQPKAAEGLQRSSGRQPLGDDFERAVSGVAVNELIALTTDPLVRARLLNADSDSDGRISRRDIVRVLKSEVSAKSRLRYGFIGGSVLLALCLLMLAANAGLTYTVVRMSQETRLSNQGNLIDKAGGRVVGTAQSAGLIDLLYAHHTPTEAAAALLSLKQLLVQADSGTISTYSVMSASLVPGRQVEFVVAAPAGGAGSATAAAGLSGVTSDGTIDGEAVAAAAGQPAAGAASTTTTTTTSAVDLGSVQGAGLALPAARAVELIRIVIDADGVHEVRDSSSASAPGRRLLASATSATGGVKGVVYDVTTGTCDPTTKTCPNAASTMNCPAAPTCGENGKLYAGPCEATADGTRPTCSNCGTTCTMSDFEKWKAGAGLPSRLSVDGPNYVRRSPPPSPVPASSPPPPSPPPPSPTATEVVTTGTSATKPKPKPSRKNITSPPPPAPKKPAQVAKKG